MSFPIEKNYIDFTIYCLFLFKENRVSFHSILKYFKINVFPKQTNILKKKKYHNIKSVGFMKWI